MDSLRGLVTLRRCPSLLPLVPKTEEASALSLFVRRPLPLTAVVERVGVGEKTPFCGSPLLLLVELG